MLLYTKHIKVLKEIRPSKFAHPYEGPYTILDKCGHNVYKLDLPPGSHAFDKFHVSLLRPYVEDLSKHDPDPRPPAVLYDSNRWTVDCILTHKKIRNIRHFLVKWEGYPREEATWEPAHHITNKTLAAYWT